MKVNKVYLFMKNMVTRVTFCKMEQFLTGSSNFSWLLVWLFVGYLLVLYMVNDFFGIITLFVFVFQMKRA